MHRRPVALSATISTTVATAIPTAVAALRTIPAVAQVAPRFRVGQQIAPLGEVENLALVQPRLDADHAVGGVRLGESVIDVGAQCVQRKLPLDRKSVV